MRYKVLYQHNEGDTPEVEYYDNFNDAQRSAEINYRYIIIEEDIVEECGETGEIRDYFELE